MECFSCKRISIDTVTVDYNDSSGNNETTQHYIQQLLGSELAAYLKSNQHVCYVCRKMIEELCKIKIKLGENLIDSTNASESDYGIIWQLLYNRLYEDDNNYAYDSLTPAAEFGRRTLSERSLSRNADVEVAVISATRKRQGAKSANLFASKSRRQLRSVQSENDRDCCVSTASSRTIKDNTPKLPDLKFDNNKQLTMVQTRGISEIVKFYCQHCKTRIPDLIDYTIHMSCNHNYLTLYHCSECGTDYLSDEHLQLHQKIHDTSTMMCGMCGQLQENLSMYQKHINKHLMYSIPCSLCDFTFLTKREYEKHMKDIHKSRKRKIEYKKYETIIKKVCKYSNTDSSQLQHHSTVKKPYEYFSKEYTFFINPLEIHPEPVIDNIGKLNPIIPINEDLSEDEEEDDDDDNELVETEENDDDDNDDDDDDEEEDDSSNQLVESKQVSSSSSSSASSSRSSRSSTENCSFPNDNMDIDESINVSNENFDVNLDTNSKHSRSTTIPTKSDDTIKDKNLEQSYVITEISIDRHDDSEITFKPPEKASVTTNCKTIAKGSSTITTKQNLAVSTAISTNCTTITTTTDTSSSSSIQNVSGNSGSDWFPSPALDPSTLESISYTEDAVPTGDNDILTDNATETETETEIEEVPEANYIVDVHDVAAEEVVVSEELDPTINSDEE